MSVHAIVSGSAAALPAPGHGGRPSNLQVVSPAEAAPRMTGDEVLLSPFAQAVRTAATVGGEHELQLSPETLRRLVSGDAAATAQGSRP